MKIHQALLLVFAIIALSAVWFFAGAMWSRSKCPICNEKTPVEKVLENRCPACPTLSDCPKCRTEYITEPCPLAPDPFADNYGILENELRECQIMAGQQEQIIETQKRVIEVQNLLLEMK